MPELPDVTLYVEALDARVRGQVLEGVRLLSPFVLRSVDPPIAQTAGRTVQGVRRMGKRIVLDLDLDLHLVIHLMIAGRLRWKARAAKPNRDTLALLAFAEGTLHFTEASTKKRASLHLARTADLGAFDRGGLEVLDCDLAAFRDRLRSENHTLKRALTDPGLLSGIGNAYSDEILHRARLSPVVWSSRLTDEEVERLFHACREVLTAFTERMRVELHGRFPESVTAFRPDMAVHGRFGQPCPVCGSPVQRIRYADNETDYCATCQTGGRLLKDRSLSALLKDDWPRSLDELEEHMASRRSAP